MIYGPFTQEDWDFLVYLKRSINAYPKDAVYTPAINKERRIYNRTLERYKLPVIAECAA